MRCLVLHKGVFLNIPFLHTCKMMKVPMGSGGKSESCGFSYFYTPGKILCEMGRTVMLATLGGKKESQKFEFWTTVPLTHH